MSWGAPRAEQSGGYGTLVDRRIELFARELEEPTDRMRETAAVDLIMCMGWELEYEDFDLDAFTETRDRACIWSVEKRMGSGAPSRGFSYTQ